MLTCLKTTACRTWIFLLGLVAVLTLTGCQHQTTISEGDLYLQAQAQQVQINTYKFQLQSARARLTQVLPAVQNEHPVFPESLAPDLAEWLHNNDCTKMTGDIKDACYKVTRVKLINTTQALDNANANIYAGQMTVNQLISNIGVLIDGFGLPDEKVPK